MKLSSLQRYILLACHDAKGQRREHSGLEQFYESEKERPSEKDAQNAVTRSLERLIGKELLIGYGVRTSHKWYLKEIRLTPRGRKVVKELLAANQARLPFTLRRSRERVDGGDDAFTKGAGGAGWSVLNRRRADFLKNTNI